MTFRDFSSRLKNFEKSRDRNVFSDYSPRPFFRICQKLLHSTNRPLRISVVGTNGKGSVAHFLGEMLQQVYEKTGIYTSPHLERFTERIKINRREIAEEELDTILDDFSDHTAELAGLSYFELLTLMAMEHFSRNSCEVEIYEAGLGGRLDATKFANPEIVVLVSIGLDHMEILGATEREIILEKLGICGENTRQIIALFQKQNHLNLILENFCLENNISLSVFHGEDSSDYLSDLRDFASHVFYRITHDTRPDFELDPDKIQPPAGRMQILRQTPLLLFDSAHNPAAVARLFHSLGILYPQIRWKVIVAALRDKDIDSMLQTARDFANCGQIHLLSGEGFAASSMAGIETTEMENLSQLLQQPEAVVVFGSFRLYAEVKTFLSH